MRRYLLTLHVTRPDGGTFQSRKFPAKGNTAAEAMAWAEALGKRRWPSCKIVAGPAKWDKSYRWNKETGDEERVQGEHQS